MNEVINTLKDHRSIRSYTNEPVSQEQLDAIINAAQAAPTSIHGQQVTVIGVQDAERKAKIAELAGNQKWIADAPVFLLFCMDFNKARVAMEMVGEEIVITDSVESTIVGATDVGIALGFAIAAAESMGLGIVPIGGARRNPIELIELLGLPQYVVPVCGLVVGHPADCSGLKPRLPKATFYHEETYNHELAPWIEQFNEQYGQYLTERGAEKGRNWSNTLSAYYTRLYYPHVHHMVKKQGFGLDR